jgi:hypothetical protein
MAITVKYGTTSFKHTNTELEQIVIKDSTRNYIVIENSVLICVTVPGKERS